MHVTAVHARMEAHALRMATEVICAVAVLDFLVDFVKLVTTAITLADLTLQLVLQCQILTN